MLALLQRNTIPAMNYFFENVVVSAGIEPASKV
jgi:hypothetical protein